jgi:hypothetical protein
VDANGSELIFFEDDKVKVFLHYKYPDGRHETKEIEIRREEPDEDEPEEPEPTEDPGGEG